MRKKWFYLVLLLLLVGFSGCKREHEEKPEILARINGYNLTLDEFQKQLASEMEMDKEFKLTRDARKAFLNELIKKEILIQEARKLKLDTREAFRRAIERYWESTLIRDLLTLKAKDIAGKTYVSEEEIEARYKAMKAGDKTLPPLNDVREEIKKKLKEEKKTALLEKWINNLKKKADIKINEKLL
ncbi:MAG: SurA N-terminal domain-containing protein [Deltaproteobacteria bacterium]|nr:SurA N-terminal domain-containing protein [Deltaproteobacteria bacterium]